MLLYITLFPSIYVLTKVDGVSVKIDGLIDLGPKWNFEYTFVPYDTNTNIDNNDHHWDEVESGNEKDDATTTTHAARMHTERVTTRKKSRHKLKSVDDTQNSGTPTETTSKKMRTPSEKSMVKEDEPPKLPEEIQLKPEKSLEILKQYPAQSEYSPGPPDKYSESEMSKMQHKSGNREKSIKILIDTTTKKLTTVSTSTGTTPDLIYKHADNKSLILRSPHKVQEDTRLRDFTVHIYKQALRVFDELRKKVNDTKSYKQIDKLIRDYREKFAEFVNETQHVTVKTRLGTQKVILNTMESSNMILRKLVDHLMADTGQRAILRNEIRGVAGLLQAQLEKEMEVEYKHVCSKFGVCRSRYVFSDFLAEVIGEIIRVDDNKLQVASDALTEAMKRQHLHDHLQPKVEKRFREDIVFAEKMNPDQIRAVLQIFRGILVNKHKPLPVMGEVEPKMMDRSLAVLELIDLFDEKVQANEENKLAWTDIKASCKDWADGNRDDIVEIMEVLVRHIMKSGLEKFDAKTKKLLNHNLKIYYDMKR